MRKGIRAYLKAHRSVKETHIGEVNQGGRWSYCCKTAIKGEDLVIIQSQEIEARAIEYVADLMCVAARTAPKGRGVDNLVTMIVKAREKDQLAEKMRRIAKEYNLPNFERDAMGVDKAALVILLGQKTTPMGLPVCGFCGYDNCA